MYIWKWSLLADCISGCVLAMWESTVGVANFQTGMVGAVSVCVLYLCRSYDLALYVVYRQCRYLFPFKELE